VQSQPRILVVDDTPRNIKVLEAMLTPRGYVVTAATSAAEALLKMAAEAPDLVLTDVVMPEMDGYELCRRLRADPATRLLPVVMVTASDDKEKVSALEAGADDFVQKPFNQAELLARVASLLRIKTYHDTILRQAAELAELNQSLETRVQDQVAELERLSRLRRFLSPQVAELLVCRPTARRCSKATGGRSPWCAASCPGSPRSPTQPPQKKCWRCCARTTNDWAASSTASKARSARSSRIV